MKYIYRDNREIVETSCYKLLSFINNISYIYNYIYLKQNKENQLYLLIQNE